MRKTSVHFKLLLDVCLPPLACMRMPLRLCDMLWSTQDRLKEKREFQTPAWLPQHWIYARGMKTDSSHHGCIMSFVTITGCWGLERDSPVKMCLFFTCVLSLCCRWGCSVGHRRMLQWNQTTRTKAKTTKKPTVDSRLPGLQSHLPSVGKNF